MLNRSAIVVRAKQPFLNWLRALPDPVPVDTTLSEVNCEPHIYLLPEYSMNDEQDALLAQFFDLVFDTELEGWWTDESGWPTPRSLSLFKQWFDVTFHSVIEDLTNAPLEDEE